MYGEAQNWTSFAARAAAEILDGPLKGITPERDPWGRSLSHLAFMAHELTRADMSPTRACRWLGYLQCGLVFMCLSDLETEKKRNAQFGGV